MKRIRKETMKTMMMKRVEVAQRKGCDVRAKRAAATTAKAATPVETKGRFRIGAQFFCLLMNTL